MEMTEENTSSIGTQYLAKCQLGVRGPLTASTLNQEVVHNDDRYILFSKINMYYEVEALLKTLSALDSNFLTNSAVSSDFRSSILSLAEPLRADLSSSPEYSMYPSIQSDVVPNDSKQKDLNVPLTEISCGERYFRFRRPFQFAPMYDDELYLSFFEFEELGISVYARTIPELFDRLRDEILVLWDEYAMEDDSVLSESARGLKSHLLDWLQEV